MLKLRFLTPTLLELQDHQLSFVDTKVKFWYFDLEKRLVSSHGREGDTPDRPMGDERWSWVQEHYIPLAQKQAAEAAAAQHKWESDAPKRAAAVDYRNRCAELDQRRAAWEAANPLNGLTDEQADALDNELETHWNFWKRELRVYNFANSRVPDGHPILNPLSIHNVTREDALELVSMARMGFYREPERVRNSEIERDAFNQLRLMINITTVCPFNGFEPSNYDLEGFKRKMVEYLDCNPGEADWISIAEQMGYTTDPVAQPEPEPEPELDDPVAGQTLIVVGLQLPDDADINAEDARAYVEAALKAYPGGLVPDDPFSPMNWPACRDVRTWSTPPDKMLALVPGHRRPSTKDES